MTSTSDDRLRQWQRNRAQRLDALPWLKVDRGNGRPVRYVADELLVRVEREGDARGVLNAAGHPRQSVTAEEVAPGVLALRAHGMDVPGAARALRRGGADTAGPNHVFISTPYEMGGPFGPPVPDVDAWSLPAGPSPSAAVRVAVVDTGIWRDSPLPSGWYEATSDDYDDTVDPDADVGHANFITGVIMSSTSNARVRIVKVLDASGLCTESQLVTALLNLPPAEVVNLSLGGFTADDQPPAILSYALGRLLTGVDRVVVAAAGNEGTVDEPYWPAAFAGTDLPWAGQVLAVAAHDGSSVCDWSNTGAWVSLAAPGSDITSTYVTQGEFTSGVARWSGTSFAAPRVAAAIAEHHTSAGTVVGAVAQVRADASTRSFGPYPGLG
jgi:thermitase